MGMMNQDSQLSNRVKLNVDLAKRNLVDTIYDQAILEGVATTFADTASIIEGGKVNNMTADDVMKIVNLKRAWQFVLSEGTIISPTDFALLTEINKIVEDGFYYTAGQIRTVPVKIGGTKWQPPLPLEADVREELAQLISSNSNTADVAIRLLLYVMKRQIFIDGNKRSAVIFANHYLITHGAGLIVIPAEKVEQFKRLLINYYEDEGAEPAIHDFLHGQCSIVMPA